MVIPCHEWGARVQSWPLDLLQLPCSKMTEHLTTFSHPWTIKDSCFPALHNPNQLIYLLWCFCSKRSVIRCSSSAAALPCFSFFWWGEEIFAFAMEICLFTVFMASRDSLPSCPCQKFLQGFSSPVSIESIIPWHLDSQKKIQMYSLPGYLPNLLSPFDFIFFFLTLLCNFWSPFWDKSSLGHPVTHPVFPGRILLNKHWRWDTPTYPPEMQGE